MKKKVIVFGSYITDLTAWTQHFPEIGETVQGRLFKSGPGGKGSNQAVAAHRAGAQVTMVTKVGKDAFGDSARDFYQAEGMDVSGIFIDEQTPTGVALITVEEPTARNRIVVVPGACYDFNETDMRRVCKILHKEAIVLAQLETAYDHVKACILRAHKMGCLTVLNPAPARDLDDELLAAVDIITPNETEAWHLTGVRVDGSAESLSRASGLLLEKGVGAVVITLGEKGAYAANDQRALHFPAIHTGRAVDTTGAGDAFNGAMAAALSFGNDFFDAVRYGVAASAISVTRYGTAPSMPYEHEIDDIMKLYYEKAGGESD